MENIPHHSEGLTRKEEDVGHRKQNPPEVRGKGIPRKIVRGHPRMTTVYLAQRITSSDETCQSPQEEPQEDEIGGLLGMNKHIQR